MDPRGYVLSVVWVAIVLNGIARANDYSLEIQWVPLNDIESTRLAFDHKLILRDYIHRGEKMEEEPSGHPKGGCINFICLRGIIIPKILLWIYIFTLIGAI
ncbi:MAG: hypothetical protein WAM14_24635 [Candidatus Nitrosopolaris sp.]